MDSIKICLTSAVSQVEKLTSFGIEVVSPLDLDFWRYGLILV